MEIKKKSGEDGGDGGEMGERWGRDFGRKNIFGEEKKIYIFFLIIL